MKIEFDLGSTPYDQAIQLVAWQDHQGKTFYNLVKQPANQRDDKVTIYNLPTEVMDKLIESVNKMKAITP